MSKRKLLLADDSMTIQKVVNLTFADEGIEVFTVGNGSLAIERLSEIEPDLVLADVHMPGLTGYEVCEQIKTSPRFSHVPVMLLVGSFEPFDEREAERVGANDYLTKPFQSIRQLIQKVTTLLNNQSGGDANESDTLVVELDNNQELQSPAADQLQNFQANQSINEFAQAPLTAQNVFDSPGQELSFGDNALDDEMIETNSGSNFAENNFAESFSPNQFEVQDSGAIQTSSAPATEQQYLREADLANENSVMGELASSEMRSTEPLSYNDIREMNSSMLTSTAQPDTQSANQNENQNDWEFFEFETKVVSEPVSSIEPAQTFAAESFAPDVFEAKSNDDFALEFDSPVLHQEAEEQLLETSDFEFVATEEVSQSESRAKDQPASFDFSTDAVAPAATGNDNEPLELDLDEMNLLQIDDEDSILDLQADETTSADSVKDAQFQTGRSEMANPVFAESQTSSGSALTQVASQAVSNMNLDFPPHVIEAIAQLVVEKLSDKVIERIAWEIVPDRFDLIVRQQMENRNR